MQPPTKLWNKNFFLQWQGQTVSRLGTQAFFIAQTFLIKEITGSATLVGLLAMLTNLPGIIMGPIGGLLADRISRKKIIMLSDLFRGLSGLLLASTLYYIIPNDTSIFIASYLPILDKATILIMVFSVSIFHAMINPVFGSAIQSSIPDIVPEDKLVSANSAGQLSGQAAIFFGQMVGGTLYRVLGPAVMFFIDSLSYFYSSFSEIFVQIPQTLPEKSKGWRDTLKIFLSDIYGGFNYVMKSKGLKETVLISALLTFFSAPIFILLPFYIEDVLKATVDWYGYMLAITGIGTVVGFLLIGIIRPPAKMKSRILIFFILLTCIGFILLGLVRNTYIAVLLGFFYGVSSSYITVSITTIVQIRTPADLRGRIFGLLAAISGSLAPIAMGLSGIIADLLDQNIPALYMGCGIIMTILVLIISFNTDFRNFLADQPSKKNSTPDSHNE
jgi:DHA3 family macrolide efflux protein-like MFS transporter